MCAERLGLFGGSFDPIHEGHIKIALIAKERCALDKIEFLIAKISPLKNHKPLFDDNKRLQLLEQAIEPYKDFTVSTIELDREGPSYTYQSVKYYQEKYPEAKLFWIMGADAFNTLVKWENYPYLRDNLHFIVISRNNLELNNKDPKLRFTYIDGINLDISSTQIRQQLV